jgi:hypothetical protein
MFDYTFTDGINESHSRYQGFLQEADARRLAKLATASQRKLSDRVLYRVGEMLVAFGDNLKRRQARDMASLGMGLQFKEQPEN